MNHSTQGHGDGERDQQSGAAHGQHRPRRARRRSRSPASATPWARARPASPRACPAIASSRAQRTARNSPRSGTSTQSRIPAKRGLAYPDIIEAARRRRRFARCGSSPPTRWSRFRTTSVLKQALSRLSIFWSCRMAFIPRRPPNWRDLVLPAAIWGEKEGTYTNSERRVSKVNTAVEPAGRSAIRLRHLPRPRRTSLAVRDELFPGWTRPADAFEEWRRSRAGRLCDYSGMTLRTARAAGRHSVAVPEGAPPQATRSMPTAISRPPTDARS